MSNKIVRVVLANPFYNLTTIRIVILYRVSEDENYVGVFFSFGGAGKSDEEHKARASPDRRVFP
jgi:spore coat polysaccharide biosynthesis protein SpsF (cytidylyltransferase family)